MLIKGLLSAAEYRVKEHFYIVMKVPTLTSLNCYLSPVTTQFKKVLLRRGMVAPVIPALGMLEDLASPGVQGQFSGARKTERQRLNACHGDALATPI